MAEEKKKEQPEGWNLDPVEFLIILLFFLSLVGSVVPTLYNYIVSGEISFYGYKLSNVYGFFKAHSFLFKFLGFLSAGAAAFGSLVFTKAGDAILLAEKAKLYPTNMPTPGAAVESPKSESVDRWGRIVKLSESTNSSDWRLAIIEADIILDELLEKLHLPGDTMGDKLKAVEKSDFLTIESAWEAHKARNAVAHEGDFLLSRRETRRIISLYEEVFKEFYLI